jgi:hypothetical protein
MERPQREGMWRDRPPEREPGSESEDPSRKQIYLRTVYSLNPGIPHFVDVPGGW